MFKLKLLYCCLTFYDFVHSDGRSFLEIFADIIILKILLYVSDNIYYQQKTKLISLTHIYHYLLRISLQTENLFINFEHIWHKFWNNFLKFYWRFQSVHSFWNDTSIIVCFLCYIFDNFFVKVWISFDFHSYRQWILKIYKKWKFLNAVFSINSLCL